VVTGNGGTGKLELYLVVFPAAAPPPLTSTPWRGGVLVTFCIRCESTGHSESVFLTPANNAGAKIPSFTTTKSYPWYTTRTPLSLALPGTNGMATNLNAHYRYRYAIYRGSVQSMGGREQRRRH